MENTTTTTTNTNATGTSGSTSTETTSQQTNTPDTGSQQPEMINIRELTGFISNNLKDKDENGNTNPILVRPSSLSQLYTLFYYEYLRYQLSLQEGNERKLPEPENDADINLPKEIVLFVLQAYFDKTTYKYFTSIYFM